MKWLKKLLAIIAIIVFLYYTYCALMVYFEVGAVGQGLLSFAFESIGLNLTTAGLALAGSYLLAPKETSAYLSRVGDGVSDVIDKVVRVGAKAGSSVVGGIMSAVTPLLILGGAIFGLYLLTKGDNEARNYDQEYYLKEESK